MGEKLNVYRDWLGIIDAEPPFDHYQLLRLKKFDDDQDRIRRHYRKLNGHVRKFSSGDYASESQQLLNEMARAMLALTDVKRKAEYDESLGRQKVGEGEKNSLEQILLRQKAIEPNQLEKAQQYAKAVGFSLRDAIAQQKLVAPETLMQAYAESIGLPFLNLSDITIDESLFSNISAILARSHSVAPVLIDNEQLLMASPNPLNLQLEEDLKLRIGMPLRMVLCTPNDIIKLIDEHYPREAADAELATRAFGGDEKDKPESTFGKVWTRVKKWVEENNKK